jgi:polyvinyl alcohol dehydrogenase (cytochrome)
MSQGSSRSWCLARGAFSLAAAWLLVTATSADAQNTSVPVPASAGSLGETVYLRSCASCHDRQRPRTPLRDALKGLSASRILRTLDFGVMMAVAYPLTRVEREAVASFLGGKGEDPPPSPAAMCSPSLARSAGRGAWEGWSPTVQNARFQPAPQAGLRVEDLGRLELAWAFGFDGDITAFGAPTVIDGVLYTGSASGVVYAIDAATGCIRWHFQANGPVRGALVGAETPGGRTLVALDLVGWAYGIDAATGRQRWSKRIDEHEATRLTGTPVVHDGIAYIPAASWEETRALDAKYPCCTFRGSVTAMRVADGSVAWQTYLVDAPRPLGESKEGARIHGPSGAGIWSAPTLDPRRGLLYVTTGDNYSQPATETSDAVVALSMADGRIRWTRQTTPNDVYTSRCAIDNDGCGPDHDYGASAILVPDAAGPGRDLLIAGQKSGMVYGLDPDREGAVVWETRVGVGGVNGGVQWGMASDGRLVYAATSDPVVAAPPLRGVVGDRTFDPAKGGGLTALHVGDGRKVWFASPAPCAPPRPGCSPAQSAAVSAIPGAVFSGSLDGHLRAFSTVDGRVVWDVDTVRDYTAVNGVAARGGSLDGAGPVIVDGMVFVNSGYPRFGGVRGNVLLAFRVRGEGR